MYASLIGSNPRQLKCDKGDELSGNGLSFLPVWIDFVFLCSKFFFLLWFILILVRFHGSWRGSVVRASVFDWRTFPDMRLIYG